MHNQDAAPPALRAPEAKELFDLYAIGLTTRKRHGEAAEAAFLAKAKEHTGPASREGADGPTLRNLDDLRQCAIHFSIELESSRSWQEFLRSFAPPDGRGRPSLHSP